MQVLVKIVLPLSLPIIATIGLFYAVGYWNTYFDALLYIQDPNKYTLQLRLRSLLFGEELNNSGVNLEGLGTQVMTQSLKMATVAVSTVPILIVYPWLQKYFVKGVMVGSVKVNDCRKAFIIETAALLPGEWTAGHAQHLFLRKGGSIVKKK